MRTALLLTCLAGVAALPAQDNEFSAPVRTTIGSMRANPDAYQNVKVVFTAQFASLGRISNPFFTQFTPTDYTNFYAWSDDQPIWEEKSYNDVFGMLFLNKSNPELEQIYKMPLYARMRCTGVVRNTFQNTPWVEVLSFSVLDERLDNAVLTHLHRGEKLMAERLWQRAVGELSMVLGDDVPAPAMQTAHKNLGICMLRMGESKAAFGYLQSAVALSEGADIEAKQLLLTAQRNPEEAIDRVVDSSSLRDSERPMWEAFETAGASSGPTRVLSR